MSVLHMLVCAKMVEVEPSCALLLSALTSLVFERSLHLLSPALQISPASSATTRRASCVGCSPPSPTTTRTLHLHVRLRASRRPRSTRWTTPRCRLVRPLVRRVQARDRRSRSSSAARALCSRSLQHQRHRHRRSSCRRAPSFSPLLAPPATSLLRRPPATTVRALRLASCRSPSRASPPSQKSTLCLSAPTSQYACTCNRWPTRVVVFEQKQLVL